MKNICCHKGSLSSDPVSPHFHLFPIMIVFEYHTITFFPFRGLFSEFCTVSYLKLVKSGIKIRRVRSKVIFVYISGCSNGWRKYSCNNSSHNLSWYVDFDLLALMVYFGVNHAKIWHRDHIMHLSCIVYRRLPGLD